MEKIDLEEKYLIKNKETLKDFGIEIIDIIPKQEKSKIPVVVAPGWGVTIETLEDFLEALSNKGRRILSLSHSRENEVAGPLSLIRSKKEVQKRGKDYSFEEIQKAFSILNLILEKNLDQVDAVAYSEGGINVSIAASEFPEKFRSITYVNPAGMVGNDSFPRLLGRFSMESINSSLKSIFKKETREKLQSHWKESLNYIFKNVPLSLKETLAISESDVMGMVESLKEKGINISIISGEDDRLVSLEGIRENMDFDLKQNLHSVKGGHFEIFLKPQESAQLINNTLETFEEKKT